MTDTIRNHPDAIKMAFVHDSGADPNPSKDLPAGTIYIEPDSMGLIQGLAVHPGMRKRGIGRLLLTEAVHQAIEGYGHQQAEVQVDLDQDTGMSPGLAVCKKVQYKGATFEWSYTTHGFILNPSLVDRSIIEEGEGVLSYERLHDAFMTLYQYKAQSWQMLKRQPQFRMDTRGIKRLLRESQIGALQHAYFLNESPAQRLTATPWQSYSTPKSPQQEDCVVSWASRRFEYASTRSGRNEVMPNNAHLFLLQMVEERNAFRDLRGEMAIGIGGAYICYDRANRKFIPFTVEVFSDSDLEILPMPDDFAAQTLESMVACAEGYRLLADQDQESYVVRNDPDPMP